MSEGWLEITDEGVDAEEITRQIHERVAHHSDLLSPGKAESIAHSLWKEMIESGTDKSVSRTILISQRDCDIVPRQYVIDWRTPILGPIHAAIRRIINAEIRRYLASALEKQSHFNRQTLRILENLSQENARLRQEIEQLKRVKE